MCWLQDAIQGQEGNVPEGVMVRIGLLASPLLLGLYSKVSSQKPADPSQDASWEFAGGD